MGLEQTNIPCPFCGSFLTDVDGMFECQEGCHAWQEWQGPDEGLWNYRNEGLLKVEKLYDWLNKIIKREIPYIGHIYKNNDKVHETVYRPGAFRVTAGCYESVEIDV